MTEAAFVGVIEVQSGFTMTRAALEEMIGAVLSGKSELPAIDTRMLVPRSGAPLMAVLACLDAAISTAGTMRRAIMEQLRQADPALHDRLSSATSLQSGDIEEMTVRLVPGPLAGTWMVHA